ncbi:MAG: hypothetical protein WC757_03625 [Candidatus Paceibacterota bacterium]
MNKKYLLGPIVILAIVTALIVLKLASQKREIQNYQNSTKDYKNASYIIEGQSISLVDGVSEIESTPGSAAKTVTRYFGNEIKHDLNDDGREDVVFLLTQEQGGSGQFFYTVAALNTPTGYIGSNAFLLGDRIAPQSINIDEGTTTKGTNRENVIVVNFATRKPSESFTVKPTVGKSIWIKLDPTTMLFGEVAQDFEGESR